jgi:aryl sulfotransferase
MSHTDEYLTRLIALPGWNGPLLHRPVGAAKQFFLDLMAQDGAAGDPFWEHIRGWWAARDLPNLMLVHYAALKADLAGEMQRIAGFLCIAIDTARWPPILEHCGFGYMKANVEKFAPRGGSGFNGGTTRPG